MQGPPSVRWPHSAGGGCLAVICACCVRKPGLETGPGTCESSSRSRRRGSRGDYGVGVGADCYLSQHFRTYDGGWQRSRDLLSFMKVPVARSIFIWEMIGCVPSSHVYLLKNYRAQQALPRPARAGGRILRADKSARCLMIMQAQKDESQGGCQGCGFERAHRQPGSRRLVDDQK